MNFDNEPQVDTLIGQLLAFVIMFEKKVCIRLCSWNTSNADWLAISSFTPGLHSRLLTSIGKMKSMLRHSPMLSAPFPRQNRKVTVSCFCDATPKMGH